MRAVLAPVVIGVVGTAILIALCLWQIQRLDWKEGLIGQIEARLARPPADLPKTPDPARDRLLRVKLEGRFGPGEIHVLSAMKLHGPGYRVVTPMTVPGPGGERRILVDLGFVPEAQKDPASRAADGARQDRMIGLMLWPDEVDYFTPEPDEGRNIWFARTVDAMAARLGTEPVMVVAEAHSLGAWPRPRPPGSDLPNNHLQYALTWGLMALTWAVMSAVWARSRLRA